MLKLTGVETAEVIIAHDPSECVAPLPYDIMLATGAVTVRASVCPPCRIDFLPCPAAAVVDSALCLTFDHQRDLP